MSKKEKQPIFCETQCSDGEDEDYIDKLIKKKGANAMNLMKDQDYFESETDKQEIIELRDSLLPLIQPQQERTIDLNTNQGTVGHSQSEQNLNSNFNPQIDDSKTPKNIIRYHKRKQTGCDDSNSSASLNTLTFKLNNSSQQQLKLNSKQPSLQDQEKLFQLPSEVPDLEHQDTIVRQSSSQSGFSLERTLSTNATAFPKFLLTTINYFNNTKYPEVQPMTFKPNDGVQKQLIMENEELKKQVISLHQQMYKLKGINKQLKKQSLQQQQQINQFPDQSKQTQNEHFDMIVDLQQKVQELQFQLQEMSELYLKEKNDKESTTIAYKRFLMQIEKQKQQQQQQDQQINWQLLQQQQQMQQNQQQQQQQQQLQQFNSTGMYAQSKVTSSLNKSPSPHRNIIVNNNSVLRQSMQQDIIATNLAQSNHQQIISLLQNDLMKKDKEISFYKNQLTSSHHLASEENVLDDLDDEDRYLEDTNQYYQITNNSDNITPYKAANNLQADFGQMKHLKTSQNLQAQQFYSYEKRSQSPLQSTIQISQIPTSSTVLSSSLYVDRPHSPINQVAFRTQNPALQNPQQLTSSSYSSTNSGSFLKQHHLQNAVGTISTNQSPMINQNMKSSKNQYQQQSSLAFQVNTNKQQVQHAKNFSHQFQNMVGEMESQPVRRQAKQQQQYQQHNEGPANLGFRKQKQQYLMTQSSGSSGIGNDYMMVSGSNHPLMSMPAHHHITDEEDEM